MPKTKAEALLLKQIETIHGKWGLTHKSEYDGKRQTVAILKVDGKYYTGHAIVSHKDTFCRWKGRVIALGRAYKNYRNGVRIELPADSFLRSLVD